MWPTWGRLDGNIKRRQRGTAEPSVTQTIFDFFPPSPTIHSFFSAHTHPALPLDPWNFCLLMRDPAGPPFIWVVCWCVYSIITQLFWALEQWAHRTPQRNYRGFHQTGEGKKKRGKRDKAKAGGELPRKCRGADKRVPTGKEILRHIYLYIYVYSLLYRIWFLYLPLLFFPSSFFFSKEGIFFPTTVFFLPRHLLCCSELKL